MSIDPNSDSDFEESEMIIKVSVLQKFLSSGFVKDEILSEKERLIINEFSLLSKDQQDAEFKKLKGQFFDLRFK